MADDDIMIDTDDLERRMDGAIGSLKVEFASLRTGRIKHVGADHC